MWRELSRHKNHVMHPLERLDAVLSDTHWWPSVDQEDDIVQKKKEEIVAHISDQDRALAEKTYRYTIYDDMTKTWGIVSNPASNVLTFRNWSKMPSSSLHFGMHHMAQEALFT
jgi:hypothetical protein